MAQTQQSDVKSMERLRPVDDVERAKQESEAEAEQQEEQEEEQSPEEELQADIAKREKERDDEIRETIAVEEKVFSDEHESIKTVDLAFDKLGDSIPFPSNMDQDKVNLKGDFKEFKVALKDIGELSVSAKREVDREGGVAMSTEKIVSLKKEKCEVARALIKKMEDKVKKFVDGVKKSLKEHAKNTGDDMTDETAEMIKMQAMFEDVFRNAEFVANRWDETDRKNKELSDLKDKLGEGAEDIDAEDAPDESRENISSRLAEGQDPGTESVAGKPNIEHAAGAATENK